MKQYRIYELAQELNINKQELVSTINALDLGFQVNNYMTVLNHPEIEAIRKALGYSPAQDHVDAPFATKHTMEGKLEIGLPPNAATQPPNSSSNLRKGGDTGATKVIGRIAPPSRTNPNNTKSISTDAGYKWTDTKHSGFLIDGSNAAYDQHNMMSLSNLLTLKSALKRDHPEMPCLIFGDANFFYELPERDRLMFQEFHKGNDIFLCPGGQDCDTFILSHAKKENLIVVSNDRFRDHDACIGVPRLTFMHIGNEKVTLSPNITVTVERQSGKEELHFPIADVLTK